jgi:uncharacterized membrane protein YccC
LPRALVGIVIVVVAAYLAGIVRDIVCGALAATRFGTALATFTYAFILAIGIIAALTQIGVAVAVTGPILFAVLGTVAGILIVGLGGGLIEPMRHRWERMLSAAEVEVVDLRGQRSLERETATSSVRGGGSGSTALQPPRA